MLRLVIITLFYQFIYVVLAVISTMMIVYIGLHIVNGIILKINVKTLVETILVIIMVLFNLVHLMNQTD